MEIVKRSSEDTLYLKIKGRLDTVSSPSLEGEITASIAGIQHLILDLEEVEYISSAGLRVILGAQKIMSKQGDMVLQNVSKEINGLFEMTGFSEILTIK